MPQSCHENCIKKKINSCLFKRPYTLKFTQSVKLSSTERYMDQNLNFQDQSSSQTHNDCINNEENTFIK